MSPLRIGVIGCGYWGPKLARNFHEMPDTSLEWVADFRVDRLEHMKSLYPEVRATKNYREILEVDVDAVAVAVPVSSHYSLAMEALRAGKHVLVEKPLAASGDQALEIAQKADASGLVAMVGHTFQHNAAVKTVRRLIGDGELGQLYYLDGCRANLGLLQPDINVIWDLAPHDISILLYILDKDPLQVSAQGHSYIQKEKKIHEVAYLTLYFPGDILAGLRLSWLDPVKVRRITAVGSEKMLVYDDIINEKVKLYDRGVDVPPYSDTVEEFQLSYRHGSETVVDVEWREPLRVECESFVNWIRTGSPSCSDAWNGVKVVRVLEAADRSLRNEGKRETVLYER